MNVGESTKARNFVSRTMVAVCCAIALVAVCCLCACSSGTQKQGAAESSISVSVIVDASAVDRGSLVSTNVSIPKDSSVYDALCASGAAFNETSGYVTSIEGLSAGDNGATSGWVYEVNGEMGQTASKDCKLANGDQVTWKYILSF